MKWSSQSRPITDLVRTSRPKTPDQPSLFLSMPVQSLHIIQSGNIRLLQKPHEALDILGHAKEVHGLHNASTQFATHLSPDSEIVMVDLAIWDDSVEQKWSWDDFGTTISNFYQP